MSKLLKHIASYLMVAVILTATLQVSVTKMTCLMSGKVVFSVTDIEDCAPTKKGCGIADKCCDFHKITFDYNTNSTLNSVDFNFVKAADVLVTNLPKYSIEEVTLQPHFNYFHNLPPPLSGMALLKTIQVYRL